MISNISSASANTSVHQYPAARNAPSSSNGTNLKEDSVQLSNETQQTLSKTNATPTAPEPSFQQIIREAADGDINALAKLALIA